MIQILVHSETPIECCSHGVDPQWRTRFLENEQVMIVKDASSEGLLVCERFELSVFIPVFTLLDQR